MPFFVYIIYSPTFDKFYIGQTRDVSLRINRHNNGYEFATSPYRPWLLKLKIEKSSRAEAMILEKKLKNLNKRRLADFIIKYCNASADEA